MAIDLSTIPTSTNLDIDISETAEMPTVPAGYALYAEVQYADLTKLRLRSYRRKIRSQEQYNFFRRLASHGEVSRVSLSSAPIIPKAPKLPSDADASKLPRNEDED